LPRAAAAGIAGEKTMKCGQKRWFWANLALHRADSMVFCVRAVESGGFY
jgi:hypothetical protein